jgi:hypothetical protein
MTRFGLRRLVMEQGEHVEALRRGAVSARCVGRVSLPFAEISDSGVAEARAAQNTAILPERPPRDQALDGGLSAKPLESFPGDAAGLAIEKRRVFDGVADSTVVSSAEIPGIFAACKHAG